MKKKNREDIQVPMPGQNPPPEPKGKHGKPHPEEEPGKKKKKKKRHAWPWILLSVLLIGILLGLLLDRGLFTIPGGPGEGFIGDTFNKIFSKETPDDPIDINTNVTQVPSPVPTVPVDEKVSDAYVTISGSKILLNDVEIDINDLIKQLTGPYKGAKVTLINDYATKGPYDNVKTVLYNYGISYSETHKEN